MASKDPLKLYICHKQVHARPLTRGAYNQLKGWQLPKGENPLDPGYMVVYSQGTKDEYVSWSPAHVFEAGYSEARSEIRRENPR
jgi:hypothetical protein